VGQKVFVSIDQNNEHTYLTGTIKDVKRDTYVVLVAWIFAFFGGYLALLIWFKDLSYSVGEIVNSKIFSAEMITLLCAGIGVTMVIPIASWITVLYLLKKEQKRKRLGQPRANKMI